MTKKLEQKAAKLAFDMIETDAIENTDAKTISKTPNKKTQSTATITKDALELAQENYKNYSIYVAQGRA